jgi:hypothetical protein
MGPFAPDAGALTLPADGVSVAGFLNERTSAPAASSSRDRLVPVAVKGTFWDAFERALLGSVLDAIVLDAADGSFLESVVGVADFNVEEMEVFLASLPGAVFESTLVVCAGTDFFTRALDSALAESLSLSLSSSSFCLAFS